MIVTSHSHRSDSGQEITTNYHPSSPVPESYIPLFVVLKLGTQAAQGAYRPCTGFIDPLLPDTGLLLRGA
jgi:hypothetical protein